MKNKIQEELNNHINNLNEKDEDGEEVFSHYRDELSYKDEPCMSISDLIKEADIETPDFNIGFEQGYMRGLEVALSLCNDELILPPFNLNNFEGYNNLPKIN